MGRRAMQVAPDAALPRVLALLLQASAAPATSDLVQLRMEGMARMLHRKLACSGQQAQGMALLDRLSEPVAAGLLLCPDLCALLRTGAPWPKVRRRLQVAAIESDEGYCNAWSVRRDRWLGRRSPPGLPGLRKAGRHFVAPALRRGVPVDLSLPAHPGVPSAGLHYPQVPPLESVGAELDLVDAAIGILDELATFDWSLAGPLLGQLVLRHEPTRPATCWGATSGIAIGRIVLVNVPAEQDTRTLGEIMLHEVTHVALDCAELVHPLWVTDDMSQSRCQSTWPSPWSGNPLTPHALVHAAVVWAVLAAYWRACGARWGADELVCRRLDVIDAGFRRLVEQESALRKAWQTLAPTAKEVVRMSVEAHAAGRERGHTVTFLQSMATTAADSSTRLRCP